MTKVLQMNLPTESDRGGLGRIMPFRDLRRTGRRQRGEDLRRQTFAAGTPLMTAGQVGAVAYFILRGMVKVHAEQEGGDVIIAILGPGEIVGEMSVLDHGGRSASVVTLGASTLLWMDPATLRWLLLTMPHLAHDLAGTLSTRLRLAHQQIQSLATSEVETRIARQIIAFAERYGEPLPDGDRHIPIRLTPSNIASLVGASREHTNKILVSYEERGCLSVDQTTASPFIA